MMLENLNLQDINPLICGWEDCDPGHSYGPASRDYLLLHYVRSGRGTLEVEGQRYPVGRGQIFVIHPGQTTLYWAHREEPWQYSWIGFTTSLPLPECFSQPVVEAMGCEHIFRALRNRPGQHGGNELFVCAKLFELLAQLGQQALPQGAATGRYVNRALNYMQSSYMEELSVARIAGQLGLDRSYFCRIFKEAVGIAPSTYLVELRLERAATLIAQQGYTPGEAAACCGYSDPVNFSRMFKRRYGEAPSRYAKQSHG